MLKTILKNLIKKIPFALSRNHGYDLYTKQIIKQVCTPTSSCVDVGCHKGEILDIIRTFAPQGVHFAFEPIPHLYDGLVSKYKSNDTIKIFRQALSDRQGQAEFNHVITNPAYSGIKKRTYDNAREKDEKIRVELNTLDNCIPLNQNIDLIKIDIEGGEYDMLKGAKKILQRCQPTLIFEHGLGASDAYGSEPKDLYGYLSSLGYNTYLLDDYLKNNEGLSQEQFIEQYYQQINYYFVASVK